MDANAISIYARWRDTDDKCNIRYRLATTNNAANGAVSSAYTLPVWLRLERASDNWSLSCSSDGTTFTAVSTQSASPGQTVYVGPFITSGSAITITADEDIVIACPTR